MHILIVALLVLVPVYVESDIMWDLKHWTYVQDPQDVFIVGIENGKNIYLGLTRGRNFGKLVEGIKRLEYVRNGRYMNTTRAIATLVDPDKVLSWIPGSKGILLLIPLNKRPIPIGLFAQTKYVARAGKPGHQTIGVLICHNFPICGSLPAVNRFGDVEYYDNYEVLVCPR